MKDRGTFGNGLTAAFRQQDVPTLVTRSLNKPAIAVTGLRYDRAGFGMTGPIPADDAYLVALQLRDCHDHDLYFEGRFVRPRNWYAGTSTTFDLRRDPRADIRDPWRCLMFHLPRTALHAVAAEAGSPRITELRCPDGVGIDDPVIRHLLLSLLPALSRPGESSRVFLDHVAVALTAHVAHAYGGMREVRAATHGGLAAWQERRVTDLLRANLNGDVPIGRLASECNLSVRHFSRAFRMTTGSPPHRWLMKQRVERARELLADSRLSLAEIALACGFSDQSHFTRVFTAMAGMSPGAWRRNSGLVRGRGLSGGT